MNSSARILLAEDDDYDARLVRATLELAAGDEYVLRVPDGKEALDYLYRQGRFAARPPYDPALVLLDLQLPRMDGFEVLSRVKGDPLLRCIPIVVLTSSRRPRDMRRAYELGANGYVVKAMDFAAYSETLRLLVRYWLDINETPPTSAEAGQESGDSAAHRAVDTVAELKGP